MSSDSELLRRFAQTNSEDAFAEIVRRHVNLVYSAALRQANGDEHLAKDVAQNVFADLARKADSLSRRENLSGWLYTSAHFAAAKIIRTENRRRNREEKFMREPTNENAPDASRAEALSEAGWEKIRPALDDAMHELKESDRDAILFRYFENRPFAEVGAKLGLNENAARMRVERALEKLRNILSKRGISTAAALASVISANAVQIAPTNLAATLTTASIATVGTGTFTLLKIMTATKLKLTLSAIVVAGAVAVIVHQQQMENKLHGENESLQQQIAQLQTDNENFSNRLAAVGDSKSLSDEQMNELLKLRGEVGVLRRQAGDATQLRARIKQIQSEAITNQNQLVQLSPSDQFELQTIHTRDAMKLVGLAMRIYAGDHNGEYPTNFVQMKSELDGGAYPTNISLDTFEFINAGSVDEKYPQMIALRERIPRHSPDGHYWVREYGLADGSVQTADSNDGNFDAWEKANTTPPPQNPNQ